MKSSKLRILRRRQTSEGKPVLPRTERFASVALIFVLVLLATVAFWTVLASRGDIGRHVAATDRVAGGTNLADALGNFDRLEDRYEEHPSTQLRQRANDVESKFRAGLASLREANPDNQLAAWLEPRFLRLSHTTTRQFDFEDAGLTARAAVAEARGTEVLAQMDHRVEGAIQAQLADATEHAARERAAAVPLLWATLGVTAIALMLAAFAGYYLRRRRHAAELSAQAEVRRVRQDERRVRQDERRTRVREERLHEAQRLAHLGSWEMDLEGKHIEASPEALRLYGVNPDHFDGTMESMLAMIHPDDRDAIAARFSNPDRFAEDGTARFATEHRVLDPDGAVRTLEVYGQLVTRSDGTVVVAETSQDVSERKESERAVEAAQEAERANLAKNAFLSRMSHELRTPLHAVLGYGQMVAESEGISDQARDDAGQILTAADHLLKLIDEVLEISRIDEEGITAEIEPLDVWSVADEADGIVHPLAAEREISIVIEPANGARYALGDPRLLRQVILNLLSNAVKYNRDGGDVRLLIERHEDSVRVSVIDTGIGIPPEVQDRLFVAFDRLGAAEGSIPGTGLGLVLSQQLCEEMGTTLEFESEPGTGSRFWFDLPVASGSHQELPLSTDPLVLQEVA